MLFTGNRRSGFRKNFVTREIRLCSRSLSKSYRRSSCIKCPINLADKTLENFPRYTPTKSKFVWLFEIYVPNARFSRALLTALISTLKVSPLIESARIVSQVFSSSAAKTRTRMRYFSASADLISRKDKLRATLYFKKKKKTSSFSSLPTALISRLYTDRRSCAQASSSSICC